MFTSGVVRLSAFLLFLLSRCEACEEDVGSLTSDPGGDIQGGDVAPARKVSVQTGEVTRRCGGHKKVQERFSGGVRWPL